MCQQGLEHLCREVDGTNYIGFVRNGAYAQYFSGPAKNAYALPDTVFNEATALIDPLMVAYHAVKHSRITLGSKVLVVGSGIIAQMIGGLAKKMGASYVAMAKISDVKIAQSRTIGEFDAYFDETDPTFIEKMQATTAGGFDVAFEAAGADLYVKSPSLHCSLSRLSLSCQYSSPPSQGDRLLAYTPIRRDHEESYVYE